MMSHSIYIGCRRDGEVRKRSSHKKILMWGKECGCEMTENISRREEQRTCDGTERGQE